MVGYDARMTNETNGLPELLTRAEAAQYMRVSTATVSRLEKRGHLRAVRIGRQWRIPVESLRAYLEGDPAPEVQQHRHDSPDYSTDPPTPSLLTDGGTPVGPVNA